MTLTLTNPAFKNKLTEINAVAKKKGNFDLNVFRTVTICVFKRIKLENLLALCFFLNGCYSPVDAKVSFDHNHKKIIYHKW